MTGCADPEFRAIRRRGQIRVCVEDRGPVLINRPVRLVPTPRGFQSVGPANGRTYNRKIRNTGWWSQPCDVPTCRWTTLFLVRRIIEHTNQPRTAEPSRLDPKPQNPTPFGCAAAGPLRDARSWHRPRQLSGTGRGDADEPVSGIFERPIRLDRPPCEVGCERQDYDSSPPARNLLERSARSLTIEPWNHSWPTTRTTLLQSLVAGPVGARVRLKPASGNRNGSGACLCRSGLRLR